MDPRFVLFSYSNISNPLAETFWAVARHVSEDAFPNQCQQRFSRTLDPTIQRGAWSDEEDAKLRLAVAAYGNSWMDVAEVIHGRTNEQCRDHWSAKVNSHQAKGRWTNEEDRCLLEAIESLGTGNWNDVSERLGTGRSDSNVSSFRLAQFSR